MATITTRDGDGLETSIEDWARTTHGHRLLSRAAAERWPHPRTAEGKNIQSWRRACGQPQTIHQGAKHRNEHDMARKSSVGRKCQGALRCT